MPTIVEDSLNSTSTTTILTTGTAITTTSSIVLSADSNKRSTRSSTGSLVQSTYMKVSVSPPNIKSNKAANHGVAELRSLLEAQQLQLSSQAACLAEQREMMDNISSKMSERDYIIEDMGLKIKKLEHESRLISAANNMKECVIRSLQGEIHRLQQYTRRYSVAIAGIDLPKDEKPEQLREKVEDIISNISSSTTVEDIDKLHRNGPINGNNQEIIVRFKSHSAKENLYKNRKSINSPYIKIRPIS